MMNILYIYRNPIFGYSIERVFRPIEHVLNKTISIDSYYTPSKRALPHCLIYDLVSVASKLLKGKYDLVHLTGGCHHLLFLVPLCSLLKIKIILTIHDLGFYNKKDKSIKSWLSYLFFVHPIKYADYIVFISDSSKQEAINLLDLSKCKTTVIPDSYDPQFVYSKHTLCKEKPTILHVGTHIRKNLIGTAKALRGFPCRLRIVGALPSNQRNALNENGIEYTTTQDLTSEQLVEEYINCDIVNFPTFYEGFGLPIIEAQAVGRPVLTSNLTPMCDVAGENAVLVDPHSPESILEGYRYIMNNYTGIVRTGLINSKRFEASSIASNYLDLYNQLQ